MAKAPKTLFIGNGVHQLSSNHISWRKLVEELATEAGAPYVLDRLDDKPFTLVYEEIHAAYVKKRHGKGDKESPERSLKGLVAESVGKLQPNDYLRTMVKLDFDHIVTTNYDYAIEQALGDDNGTTSGRKVETKYSAHRFRNAGGKKVWHIHGEVENPWSICLGNDHYAGYLHKLREMVVTKKEDDRLDDRGRIGSYVHSYWQSGVIDSWMQLFTTGLLDIVGFGMDYTEIDLWWLIGNRARQMSGSNNPGYKLGHVTYHQFVSDKEGLTKRDEGRLEILKSLDVEINRIDFKGKDYRSGYDTWIKSYRNKHGIQS